MKKPCELPAGHNDAMTFEDLIGLGHHSARKNYYPELEARLAELETERNRYKWLFENALHGIFQATVDGRMLAANPAIARLCGYRSGELICQHQSDLRQQLFADPADYDRLMVGLQALGKVLGFETRLKRTDGSDIPVSMNVLLKREEGQELVEAFVHDITERVRSQNRMRQLNEQLEARVEARTSELVELNQQLQQARDEAEQANQSKDRYFAAASHDLLQPMNAARLLVATLRERSLEAEDAHFVERIHQALEGAEELLSDLLDISRLDQNAVQPDIEVFPMSEVLAPLVNEFQPVAENEGLALRVVNSRLPVRTDARLLRRILRNFISNAMRYTQSGRVLLGCRRQGGNVRIQVWDTGEGIPQERLQDIFAEFKQLPCSAGKGRQGVGLGLAIVDRIARMLGHSIDVCSTPGRGSMFAIDVPISAEPPSANRLVTAASLRQHQLSGRTILVVDNEERIRVSMKALLSQWGCQVLTAESPDDAVRCCASVSDLPELLIVDYHLDEGLTGLDTIQKLRDLSGESIPALVITADRSDLCRQLFRQQGLPVLNKPVKPGKLRALMTHLLPQSP